MPPEAFEARLKKHRCRLKIIAVADLSVWPEMTHAFQAHGLTRPKSTEAIGRIEAAIAHDICAGGGRPAFAAGGATEIFIQVAKEGTFPRSDKKPVNSAAAGHSGIVLLDDTPCIRLPNVPEFLSNTVLVAKEACK